MSPTAETVVHRSDAGGIATLTLDSPANRNALSSQLVGELSGHLSDVAADDAVRAVVVTHTGTTFCAGADLAESAREGGPARGTQRLVALLRQILELPRPVVCRVEGNVRAGGLGVLAACDLAVAGPTSSFALTEARLGLAPAIISLTVLPRLSARAASRYFLTGDRFDSTEAERIGLITLAAADPAVAVDALVESFRSCSPQGLAASKALTTRHLLVSFDADAAELSEVSGELFASEDAQEGIASFLERRPRAGRGERLAAVTEPQQDRSRATRLALLEAAVGCLADVGWSGSTVAVVAGRAGVSRGAAQHHFRTREDLFVAAIEHMAATRAAELQMVAGDEAAEPVSTRRVVEMLVEVHTSDLFRAALALWVASAAEPQLRGRVIELESRTGRLVHRATVQLLGVDDGDPAARALIQATLDMARGLGLADLLTDDRARREPIVAQWAAVLDEALGRGR